MGRCYSRISSQVCEKSQNNVDSCCQASESMGGPAIAVVEQICPLCGAKIKGRIVGEVLVCETSCHSGRRKTRCKLKCKCGIRITRLTDVLAGVDGGIQQNSEIIQLGDIYNFGYENVETLRASCNHGSEDGSTGSGSYQYAMAEGEEATSSKGFKYGCDGGNAGGNEGCDSGEFGGYGGAGGVGGCDGDGGDGNGDGGGCGGDGGGDGGGCGGDGGGDGD